MNRKHNDVNYNLVFWSLNKQQIIKTTVLLDDETSYKIKNIRHPFEQFNYEVFAGMVITELTVNHIENLDRMEYSKPVRCLLDTYKTLKNRTKNVLFISSVLQGSYVSTIDDLSVGGIITNVNGQKVGTVDDFKRAIKDHTLIIDGKRMMYMRLKDKSHILINIDDAFLEESLLSQRYKYTISSLYDKNSGLHDKKTHIY